MRHQKCPFNIQLVDVVRELILLDALSCSVLILFSLLLLSVLNDLTGPSDGPLAQKSYSIPSPKVWDCSWKWGCGGTGCGVAAVNPPQAVVPSL